MSFISKSTTVATGLAMFSMFFGAGNVVFPLALGQIAKDQNFYAILGMLITAVGVPFIGLIAMTLFDGNYEKFFGRIGKVPGFIISLIIMGLIGSFGALPRCIALSYATAKIFLPTVSLPLFSAISCLIIWLFTIRRNSIVETLGYFLTPILIGSLAFIIIKGLFLSTGLPPTEYDGFSVFLKGLKDGYLTMDLLGAFFFSSVIIACLKEGMGTKKATAHELVLTTLKASCIGASLLAITYIGFSYVASAHSLVLDGISSDQLIGTIAVHILGESAAIMACVVVSLACLTTAIALAAVFAEFLHKDICKDKVPYNLSLLITLVITFFVSILDFNGITAFLGPVLQLCYPSLIVLSICNVLYKLYDFKMVKTPVLITFLLSIWGHFSP